MSLAFLQRIQKRLIHYYCQHLASTFDTYSEKQWPCQKVLQQPQLLSPSSQGYFQKKEGFVMSFTQTHLGQGTRLRAVQLITEISTG